MSVSRREFLRLAGVLAGGAAASACSPIYRQLSDLPAVPSHWPAVSPHDFRVLSRLTYGATADERAGIIALGWRGWVEQQLDPESIVDDGVSWRLRPIDALTLRADALEVREQDDVVADLQRATLLRRVYSRRQLYEKMVEFWTDHFNISVAKGDCWYLKVVDDRQVVRKHALGSFRELLQASAHSPAMLVYLDNQANSAEAPNENYAREMMELHTLSVEGGYSQADVMELARCLTGWKVKNHFWKGEFEFQPDLHDNGTKRVLGREIQPNGVTEAEGIVDRLAEHPSTARFLARKLAQRFVAEQPSERLVSEAAGVFLRTHGSIRDTLRHVLLQGLPAQEPKFKRPTQFVAGALRMLAADTDAGPPLEDYLTRMGQPTFGWPTPDGPPDRSGYWASNLLPRWQFAIGLARGEIGGTALDTASLAMDEPPSDTLDRLALLTHGVPLEVRVKTDLLAQIPTADSRTLLELGVAGLLASPGFQWH